MTRSASAAAIRAVPLATLVAGTLDIGAAIVTNPQVTAQVVLQSVAAGWLGPATYRGGWPTAWLGLASHFGVMLGIAAVFVFAATRLPALRRLWFPAGVAYGVAVWLAMTYVVVPLSASTLPPPDLTAALKGLAIHMLCVGLPIAGITRRVLGAPAAA